MIKKNEFQRLLAEGDFRRLFIEELGWNKPKSRQPYSVTVDDVCYDFTEIADRNGFKVLAIDVERIPVSSLCRKIDTKLRRMAEDYIAIYRERGSEHHLWVVPVRGNEKRDLVLVEYENAGKSDVVFSKAPGYSFGLTETTTIVDVRSRVHGAFIVNSEKITKDFYSDFKKQHASFTKFISGIEGRETSEQDRKWYASVMLNRLMFCYFIQKKGFLNGETDYLRKRFDAHVKGEENGTFFDTFYLDFLRHLFVDGLNDPGHDMEFVKKFGRIPYLNGGMFEEHQLEKEYADLDIADEAFDRLFSFFDQWNWHLDTRITASGKDINPDVLGYIFEQYINDRAQMGAYYTKEDITEYIGRNSILPFLFDKVKNATKDSVKDFQPDGYVWRTLRESGDRYIFDAVKKGYDKFGEIPEEISRGIITKAMRKEYAETPVGELPANHIPLSELRAEWNKPTPETWGLPTEIWRETIERLQRCDDILKKIENGEITEINDFITYNLDIRQFALDLLDQTQDRAFIKHFYAALQSVTILDPTCGSGAFLFAAMNILEPLYERCITRMQEFHEQNPEYFKKELEEVERKYRSNIQYFIYKSIILRNLYGVDIMVEATEIAKLRLFLKMVAVVEVDYAADNLGLDPLPDIDFNIRCGNTLVGYANEEELNRDLNNHNGDFTIMLANEEFKARITDEMVKVAMAFQTFRRVQLTQAENMVVFKQAKHELREKLSMLKEQLNGRCYKATIGTGKSFSEWEKDSQPFHWLAEFYDIIQGNGGFDVIIGNPPYVEISKTIKQYSLKGFSTIECGNLYACVYERSLAISSKYSYVGMIVQLPIVCTDRMQSAQELLQMGESWTMTFDDRPGKLFDDLQHIRATIFISRRNESKNLKSSRYIRWYAETRPTLFKRLIANETLMLDSVASFPKIPNEIGRGVLQKLSNSLCMRQSLVKNGYNVYYHNAPQYFTRCTTFKPFFWNQKDGEKLSVSIKSVALADEDGSKIISDVINSGIFYFWFIMLSDCRHLNLREIEQFPIEIQKIEKQLRKRLCMLSDTLMKDYTKNKYRKTTFYKTTGEVRYDEYYPKLSKPIIDEIDRVLAKHYGFTDEELDFIINYDIKYRMGDELNANE